MSVDISLIDLKITFWEIEKSWPWNCPKMTPSSRVSPKLTRPTLFYVHCVPQEGGRMQGWESVFWGGSPYYRLFNIWWFPWILRLRPCRRPLYSGLLFVGCVFRSSAEICVVSGCSFAVTCFTNHGDFGTDVVSFGSQKMLFGMLVASNLAPWGTIERFRGTWEHKKGDLGVPGLDDGKHSPEWLELQLESVSFLNRGVWGDWAGKVIGRWDFHWFCRYIMGYFLE